MMNNKKYILAVLLLLAVFAIVESVAQIYYSDANKLVLEGYDVVAYHTQNEAVLGSRKNSVKWNDLIWYFSSKKNAKLFTADPEKYAPQYGGYCAYAVANDAVASVDPEAFTVIDEKLYLNFSKGVHRRWSRRSDVYIEIGDENWPGLLKSLQ